MGMLSEPLAHLVIGPVPLERMRVTFVVLRPSEFEVIEQLIPAGPGCSFQVATAECMDQQLGLVQPRGMGWREPGSPPTLRTRPVCCRRAGGMTGVAVLDQEHSFQITMSSTKGLQFLDVVIRIFLGLDCQFHPAGVNDQEQQQVDRAMPNIFEFLVLDGAGDGSPDRTSFQYLKVGDLIDADDPETICRQTPGISVTPEHLLSPFLEGDIQA